MPESRAHVIELNPNNKQRTYFARACGCARKAYNWGVDEWPRLYALHKADPSNHPKPDEMLLRRLFNAIKRKQFPYMLEVTKCAPQQALRNLGRAYKTICKGARFAPPIMKATIHSNGRSEIMLAEQWPIRLRFDFCDYPRIKHVIKLQPLVFEPQIATMVPLHKCV